MAAGAAMGVLYGLYEACNGHPLTVEVAAFYSAVNRQVWAACVAWVVIACVTGNGGKVASLICRYKQGFKTVFKALFVCCCW